MGSKPLLLRTTKLAVSHPKDPLLWSSRAYNPPQQIGGRELGQQTAFTTHNQVGSVTPQGSAPLVVTGL